MVCEPKTLSIWPFKKKFTEPRSRTYLRFVLSRGKDAEAFIHGLPSLMGYQLFLGVSSAPEVTLRHRDLSAERRKLSADMGPVHPSRWRPPGGKRGCGRGIHGTHSGPFHNYS